MTGLRKPAAAAITLILALLAAALLLQLGPLGAQETPVENATDRAALMDLWNATDGPNWRGTITGWNTDAHIRTWTGVKYDETEGHVTTIDLPLRNLTGEIPESIGNMEGLEELLLRENNLTGLIPESLGNLTGLRQLDLGRNQLRGEIPLSMTNLRIPNLLADGTYSTGTSMNLDRNWRLCTSSPTVREWLTTHFNYGGRQFGQLCSRQVLEQIYDQTGGASWTNNTNWKSDRPLSEWYGVTVNEYEEVTHINLNDNNLTGPLTAELDHLYALEQLNMYSNSLNGGIPRTLGSDNEALHTIMLFANDFSGEIPAELGNIPELQILLIARNDLTGNIPANFGNLSNLEQLTVGSNNLSGVIPTELKSMGSDGDGMYFFVYEDNTGLCSGPDEEYQTWLSAIAGVIGPICDAADRAALQSVYEAFGGAGWTWGTQNGWGSAYGPLSDWSGITIDPATMRVTEVDLANAHITGTLSPALGLLSEATVIRVSENPGLAGTIPTELGNLPKLTRLALGKNSLAGRVPTEIADISTLEQLYLGNNLLYGQLPPDLPGLPILEEDFILTFQNNAGLCYPDTDEYHDWLHGTKFASAQLFHFGPRCTGDYLAVVDLYDATGGNSWTDNTKWVGRDPMAEWHGITVQNGKVTEIRLPGNNLTGKLPEELDFPNLRVLDLQGNALTGPLPSAGSALKSLESLNLNGNEFTGTVPAALAPSGSRLKALGLAGNELSGQLPGSLEPVGSNGVTQTQFASGFGPAPLVALTFAGNSGGLCASAALLSAVPFHDNGPVCTR